VKATEVTTGLTESNGSLLPGLWRDSLHVTCGLTACTPGSAPGPTLGTSMGKLFTFYSALELVPAATCEQTSIHYRLEICYSLSAANAVLCSKANTATGLSECRRNGLKLHSRELRRFLIDLLSLCISLTGCCCCCCRPSSFPAGRSDDVIVVCLGAVKRTVVT